MNSEENRKKLEDINKLEESKAYIQTMLLDLKLKMFDSTLLHMKKQKEEVSNKEKTSDRYPEVEH
jgi:hypothetical protein